MCQDLYHTTKREKVNLYFLIIYILRQTLTSLAHNILSAVINYFDFFMHD